MVVNFDLPIDQSGRADCETYLHRIGRTGRFGKSGVAINLVDGPRSMQVLQQIEQHFSKFLLAFPFWKKVYKLSLLFLIGRPILKLDAEDVDEIEKLNKEDWLPISTQRKRRNGWLDRHLWFLPLIASECLHFEEEVVAMLMEPKLRRKNKRKPKRFCAF